MRSAARKLTSDDNAERDAVFAALDRAPVDEPIDPEIEAEYVRRAEDLRSGRVLGVRHDLVQEKIAQLAREIGE